MEDTGKKYREHRSGGKKLKSSELQENPASNLVWRWQERPAMNLMRVTENLNPVGDMEILL